MLRIAVLLYGVTGSTLAGTAVVAALLAGVTGLWGMLAAAATGFAVAVPVVVMIAKALDRG